jgi:hypothetical protein
MRLSNFYDLKSLDSFKKTSVQDAGVLLQRHLIAVDPEIYRVEYPELVFKNLGLDINNTGGFAKQIQSLRLKATGAFQDIGSDNVTASLSAESSLISVRMRGLPVEWDDYEVKAAQALQVNVVDEKMRGVLEIYHQEIDTSALLGLSGNNGLLTNTDYDADVGVDMSVMDAEELYNYIKDRVNFQKSAVRNALSYQANVCLLPLSIYNRIENEILNKFNDASVLTVLKKNLPTIKFVSSAKAEEVWDPSSSTYKRVMVLFSNDRKVIKFRIPMPMKYEPIFRKHSTSSTVARYHTAGLDILEPSSGLIVRGI